MSIGQHSGHITNMRTCSNMFFSQDTIIFCLEPRLSFISLFKQFNYFTVGVFLMSGFMSRGFRGFGGAQKSGFPRLSRVSGIPESNPNTAKAYYGF